MEKHIEPIRIGKVSRGCERCLKISLTGNTGVYIRGEDLDRIANKRPEDYLIYVDQIGSIVKTPDFVGFDEEREEVVFSKSFYSGGVFQIVYVVCRRTDGSEGFIYSGVCSGQCSVVPQSIKPHYFARPEYKKVTASNESV